MSTAHTSGNAQLLPRKSTLVVEGDLVPVIIHGSVGLPESTTERHIDRFNRFAELRVVSDKHTDTRTHTHTHARTHAHTHTCCQLSSTNVDDHCAKLDRRRSTKSKSAIPATVDG